MTWDELQEFEALLKEEGFKKGVDTYGTSHCDYLWYKGYGKKGNMYEDGRSLFNIFINVYDWRKFHNRDPYLKELHKDASVTVRVSVSRMITECGKDFTYDCKEDVDLGSIIEAAWKFYHFVDETFEIDDEL